MKLSVFYDHILQAHAQSQKSLPEVLRLVRSMNISAVEMEYTMFEAHKTDILPLLSDAGLSISCFYEFFEFHKNEDISRGKAMLKAAAEHHVSRVLIVPGALESLEAAELLACSGAYETASAFMDHNPAIQSMKRALTGLTSQAAACGVTVTLEDFDGFCQPFSRMNQLLWFMQNVPGLRFTLDMGNFAFGDEDAVLATKLLADSIVHVHCKDRALSPHVQGTVCRGLGPSPAGYGYLPIREMVSLLKEHGYDGYLAIEHFGAPDQLSFIRKSADFLKNCVDSDD